jgi:hypothetical protein
MHHVRTDRWVRGGLLALGSLLCGVFFLGVTHAQPGRNPAVPPGGRPPVYPPGNRPAPGLLAFRLGMDEFRIAFGAGSARSGSTA